MEQIICSAKSSAQIGPAGGSSNVLWFFGRSVVIIIHTRDESVSITKNTNKFTSYT